LGTINSARRRLRKSESPSPAGVQCVHQAVESTCPYLRLIPLPSLCYSPTSSARTAVNTPAEHTFNRLIIYTEIYTAKQSCPHVGFAQYTPPTRVNSTVETRRRRRCVLGLSHQVFLSQLHDQYRTIFKILSLAYSAVDLPIR